MRTLGLRHINVANPPPPSTGWTAPAATYEKMRQMQVTSAAPFDIDVQTLVKDPVYKAAWDAWYRQGWLPFYERYAGAHSSRLAQIGVLVSLSSDELAQRAESYREQLESFYQSFPGPGKAHGAPPYLGGLPEGGTGLPWWIWLGAIAVVGGVGYLGYRTAKELTAKRKAIETKVLPHFIGKDLAEAAAAR